MNLLEVDFSEAANKQMTEQPEWKSRIQTKEKSSMTKAMGNIHIDAPRDKVWAILADLETVRNYDSEIINAFYISDNREGVGAARQCDLPDGGYIKERITEWNPGEGYSLIVDEGTGTEFFESQVVRLA